MLDIFNLGLVIGLMIGMAMQDMACKYYYTKKMKEDKEK